MQNNKPYYQELIEKRGEQPPYIVDAEVIYNLHDSGKFQNGMPVMCNKFYAHFQPDYARNTTELQAKTEAEYAALAINNFSPLVEALETALARLGTFAESNAWEPEDEQAYNIAANALEAISKRPE